MSVPNWSGESAAKRGSAPWVPSSMTAIAASTCGKKSPAKNRIARDREASVVVAAWEPVHGASVGCGSRWRTRLPKGVPSLHARRHAPAPRSTERSCSCASAPSASARSGAPLSQPTIERSASNGRTPRGGNSTPGGVSDGETCGVAESDGPAVNFLFPRVCGGGVAAAHACNSCNRIAEPTRLIARTQRS